MWNVDIKKEMPKSKLHVYQYLRVTTLSVNYTVCGFVFTFIVLIRHVITGYLVQIKNSDYNCLSPLVALMRSYMPQEQGTKVNFTQHHDAMRWG